MVDLGTFGGVDAWANGVNNRGQVVGMSSTSTDRLHAFVWQNGSMTDLGTVTDEEGANLGSEAFDINNRGLIVGLSGVPSGDTHAVIWRRR
jgi:probable HAF family extracellular repeat protein